MRALVTMLQADAHDPERTSRYRHYAFDILLDGLGRARRGFDPEFHDMSDEERTRYIADQAQRLAPELLLFVQAYALQRLETVETWRRRTRGRG